MQRIEKVNQYWQQQEPTVQSMYKRWVPPLLNEEEIYEILSYLPDLQNKNILDLAAGVGRFTQPLSCRAKQLISIDKVPHFVEKNKTTHTNCKNVSFLCSDAMDLQFKEGYFDLVFINWLFMYLGDKESATLIERIHKWLKPDGMLFFRETSDFTQRQNLDSEYHAEYRPLAFYEKILENKFRIIKEGSIQAHIDYFADPAQSFWLCQKG